MEKKTGQSHRKSMTVNGVELTDPLDITNHFNDYFVSVAEKLVKKVPKTNDNPLINLGPVSLIHSTFILLLLKKSKKLFLA